MYTCVRQAKRGRDCEALSVCCSHRSSPAMRGCEGWGEVLLVVGGIECEKILKKNREGMNVSLIVEYVV